jgi:hypothetical protein
MPRFAIGTFMKNRKTSIDETVAKNKEIEELDTSLNKQKDILTRKRKHFAALKEQERKLEAKVSKQ